MCEIILVLKWLEICDLFIYFDYVRTDFSFYENIFGNPGANIWGMSKYCKM